MSFYQLFTSTGNADLIKFLCGTGNNDLCEWAQDNVPEATEVRDFSEENLDDFSEIISSRLKRLERNRRFGLLSVGEPDYLSSAFLERGLRCSATVCLLDRGYWIDDLIEQIKSQSTQDFPEILGRLSDKIDLLPAKRPGGPDDIWKNYDSVSEALKDPIIEKKLNEFKEKLDTLSQEERKIKGTVFVPFATGFLVGTNYLMTNAHVFNEENKEDIKNFIARFRFEQSAVGQEGSTIDYQLDPDRFCISDKQLDFTITRIKTREDYQQIGLRFPEAGDNFGWLPLFADPALIAPPISRRQAQSNADKKRILRSGLAGEPVFIIQHPRGTRRKIVLFNNRIQHIYQNFLQYEADADFGSSGSPVFNSEWQLVGLHHAALVKWKKRSKELEFLGNLGTRTCKIVNCLEANRHKPSVEEFLDNERYVVKQGERPFQGTIHVLVGHKRVNTPNPDHANQEVNVAQFLLEKIARLLSGQPEFDVKDVFQECSEQYEAGIEFINQQGYQHGDIAIEIRTNFYPEEPVDEQPVPYASKPKVTIYYADNRTDHKAYAEIVLAAFLRWVPGLPNIVISDTATTKDIDLQFCRDVKMPSLVLNLDFLGMTYAQVMRDIDAPIGLQQRISEFHRGIAHGLENWVKVLSPIGFWNTD